MLFTNLGKEGFIMSNEQQRKAYSLRLINSGIAGKWLASQDNVTNSINEAIILVATKYGTGDLLNSLPAYTAQMEQLNITQQNEIRILRQALVANQLTGNDNGLQVQNDTDEGQNQSIEQPSKLKTKANDSSAKLASDGSYSDFLSSK